MNEQIGVYDFPDHKRGDTFPSVAFTLTVDGVPLNCSGSNVLSQFRAKDYSPVVLEFTTSDGTITIEGMDNNIIRFNERSGSDMLMDAGKYFYDVDIQFPDGTNKTYIEGTINITTDYSRRNV